MARPGSCPACGAPAGSGNVCAFCGAALPAQAEPTPPPAYTPPTAQPDFEPPSAPPPPRATHTPPPPRAEPTPDFSQYIPDIQPQIQRGFRRARRGCTSIAILIVVAIMALLILCGLLIAFSANLSGLPR